MNIPYKVAGQEIQPASITQIRAGTRGGAVSLAFSFDQEWSQYPAKACAFSLDGQHFDDIVPIKSGCAPIPDRYCDRDFYICLIGSDEQKKIASEIKKVSVI